MAEKTVLEIIAPTVEDAIQSGLEQLGLERNAVDIEILDAGTRGIFGIGNRQARVRLVVKPFVAADEDISAKGNFEKWPNQNEPAVVSTVIETKEKPLLGTQPFDVENALDVAQHVVEELLEKMKVHASITTEFVEAAEPNEQPMIHVDIQGNDLSILIGRQAETLNAMQYISSLIVAKELGHWITLLVDVQGYRSRREQQLRKLARRLADQALNTGRRQVLEPMPANERRYIHLELRNHPDVSTESIGEEPNRKVTITLKH